MWQDVQRPVVEPVVAPEPVKVVAKPVPAPEPVKVAVVKHAPVPEPVRAHDADGHFAKDDPATLAVNEAFVGGVPVKPEWTPAMTKSELISVARKLGIDTSSMTKAEVLAALEALPA